MLDLIKAIGGTPISEIKGVIYLDFIKEVLKADFIRNLWESDVTRFLIIMFGFHVVLGIFGRGCCGSKKHKKESKDKDCH